MPLHVLIAPDKFKGTLSAGDAAEAIARGWNRVRPNDSLELLPITDGGDGFGEAMGKLLQARLQTVETLDAAHRPCRAKWWWEPRTRTAIIESAGVIGLAMLPAGKFHPFEVDTLGLGVALQAARGKGARRCLIGIGGSATNDGGFGLARSLGWQFLNPAGALIERWTDLSRLEKIRPPRRKRLFGELLVAVDVQNPLLGPTGASRVYGPQKGLRRSEYPRAERALTRLAAVVKRRVRTDLARTPGAGAAGGLGFGLPAFCGATLVPGFELFAGQAGLTERLEKAHLVLTGEGAIDDSTLMGKGVGQLASMCQKARISCVGLAGTLARGARFQKAFTLVRGLTELTSLENAKARPAFWLERLTQEAAGACPTGRE